MLVANLTYSPDDGGFYATIWDTADGKDVDTLPRRGVAKTRDALLRAVRKQYGGINIHDTP